MNKFRFLFAAFVAVVMGSLNVWAQPEMRTIEIGMYSTTHVLFTSDLTYVDISSQDVIAAKVVDASKNMLALKARSEFNFVTTISALEANGTLHTFKVRYNSFPQNLVIDTRVVAAQPAASGQVNTQIRPERQQVMEQPVAVADKGDKDRGERKSDKKQSVPQITQAQEKAPVIVEGNSPYDYNVGNAGSNFGRRDAPTIEEVMRKEQQIFHCGSSNYGMEVYCTNVFVYSDITYITLQLHNKTDIGYEAGEAQFTIENKHKRSESLSSDRAIWPKSSFGTLSCNPQSTSMVGYTIPKLTLQKNEVLRIYVYEKSGNRNLIMTLTDKDLNYAVSPF